MLGYTAAVTQEMCVLNISNICLARSGKEGMKTAVFRRGVSLADRGEYTKCCALVVEIIILSPWR